MPSLNAMNILDEYTHIDRAQSAYYNTMMSEHSSETAAVEVYRSERPGYTGERPIALITGATSGIGAEFAAQLAARGCDLVLIGRRVAELADRARELEARFTPAVRALACDLALPECRDALVGEIRKLARLDWLVNNAGYGRGVAFTEDSYHAQRALLAVLLDAVTELTHAAAGQMRQGAQIVNVSSLAGFGVSRRSAVYCAAKAYVTSFSESLALELAPRGIGVLALLPGYTYSDFHRYDARARRNRGIVRWQTAAEVAREAMKAVERGRVICIPGRANRLLYLLAKLLPRRVVYRIMAGGEQGRVSNTTPDTSIDTTSIHTNRDAPRR